MTSTLFNTALAWIRRLSGPCLTKFLTAKVSASPIRTDDLVAGYLVDSALFM